MERKMCFWILLPMFTRKFSNSLCSYVAASELNVFDNASPSVTRSHGLRTRKTTTRTTTTANVSFGTFRRWCLGDGVVHHFSHTTRGRMVFAIPLADDHPDNALKDGYLSRSEPGMLSCDSTTGIDGNLFEFACYDTWCGKIWQCKYIYT